ncbi:uncharacterized protein [Chironomus tepperi]|uniref:uncharacterized protein n=1 Tax=Chironomus tepperi TaxID=113505 RepID=UPI00391F4B83
MILKVSILILVYNLNFVANFPVENFSIEHNETEVHEFKEVNGYNVHNNSQSEADFELVHEFDDDKRIIKKRNTNEQENSAENHIHNHDNHSHHHSNGFSYQRPSNVPKESAESHHHHQHHHVTEISTKNTMEIDGHTAEASSHSTLNDSDVNQSAKPYFEGSNHEDSETSIEPSSDGHTTEVDHLTAEQKTELDHLTTEQNITEAVTDSVSIQKSTASIIDGHQTEQHNDTNKSTKSNKIASKVTKILINSKESSSDCEDSVEESDVASKNSTRNSKRPNGSQQGTTKSMDHTVRQNLTTTMKKLEEKSHQNSGKPENHTSTNNSIKATKSLRTSTMGISKKDRGSTKSSIEATLHHSTSQLSTTDHHLLDSSDHSSTNSPQGTNKSTTAVDPKHSHDNHHTDTKEHDSDPKSHETNLKTTQNSNHSTHHVHQTHNNTNPNSTHNPNHTTPHETPHSNPTHTPKHNHTKHPSHNSTSTKNPSNHKIIHSQDTTHFDEWTIADKIESQEDNKLGTKHSHKKTTIHAKSTKSQNSTTTTHHESINLVQQHTESTTEYKVRFAIPRVAQKQSQGMKNDENSRFDHNHLDDDVEILRMTEKSMTAGGRRQTEKHNFKFVG